MNFPSFRHPFAVLLPALFLFASCGKKSDPTPAPEQGRVLFVHTASNVNTVGLKFLVDKAEKASLNYGQASGYQSVDVGSRAVQVTAGGQAAANTSITVEKGKSYSFFATPSSSSSSVNTLFVADDATLPTVGKARIRVVNVGQNLSTPIRLAQTTAVAGAGVIVNDVATNTASSYVEFIPGNYSLFISDNANNSLIEVGDGSGSGTGTKNFEANKLYTVVVAGTQGSLIPEQKIRVFVSQNN